MSEKEETRLRHLEKMANAVANEYMNDTTPPEVRATIIGTLLAVADALFAIRDEKSWRGLQNSQEIAGKLLRDLGLGE